MYSFARKPVRDVHHYLVFKPSILLEISQDDNKKRSFGRFAVVISIKQILHRQTSAYVGLYPSWLREQAEQLYPFLKIDRFCRADIAVRRGSIGLDNRLAHFITNFHQVSRVSRAIALAITTICGKLRENSNR